ncbi:MAG: hypothetical protein H6709_20695 [Kofleriaceae bacterium]|nr:hypothetical protein [Myxococcales bacterium]MCB9560740.1 hypothetical protein [Kofleriaceae bacterium]MCB9574502.1 hypothetical protein [Kofleriaceae bacterium]
MTAPSGFSWSSVILSYFQVAGGIAVGMILLVLIGASGEPAVYGALALGGAIGGFAAGRASRGTTITEPAIGGLLVIATIVAVFVGTGFGEFLWHVARGEISRIVLIAGAAAAAGALGGAVVAERVVGGHAASGAEWLAHVALAVLGASIVALVVVMGMVMHGGSENASAGAYFGAVAVGTLLSGLATGASAPRRLLLISLLATVVGVFGFYLLMAALPGVKDKDGDAALGFLIIGAVFGLLTMLGSFIGWKTVGEKHVTMAATAAAFE